MTGTGPLDLLMVPGMHSHLEVQWQLPGYRRFVRGLTRHCRHKNPLAARGISDALLGAELLADHVLRGWDNDLDQALHLYALELTRRLRPTACLNDELAGLDLPAEQARRTWQALQAAERQISLATSLPTPSS